jgi:large conductance mechanosensitive channel
VLAFPKITEDVASVRLSGCMRSVPAARHHQSSSSSHSRRFTFLPPAVCFQNMPHGGAGWGAAWGVQTEYGVIGLAIAVVIGGKANILVTALVDGVLMPAVTFFLPSGAWRTATLDVGAVHLIWGPVLGAGLDFLIVAWLVFWFSKKVLKEASVTKK